MNASDLSHASRPTRLLTLSSLLAWTLVAIVLPLLALTLNALQVAGFPLGFWFTAQGALVALVAIAWIFVWRAGGERGREGRLGPAVFAGESIGSAGFFAYAGLVALIGYDALSYPLGVAAGLALMTILIAPRFALYPVSTLAGYFTARFGGLWPRRIMLAILLVATLMLLAADIRGAGLAVVALTGADLARSLSAIAVVLSLAWLGLELAGQRRRWGLVFAALLLVSSGVLIALAVQQHRLPLPYWSYGFALKDVADIEIGLVTQKLADVRVIRPMVSAFLQYSTWNFAGIVLAVGLGLAVLPQLVGRHLSRSTVAPGEASRRAALNLTLVAVFLCGVAPFAVFARYALGQLINASAGVSALPTALTQASGAGWVSICGAQTETSADIVAACAKVPGHKGILRLQDLNFDPDAYVFTLAKVAGLPQALWLALAVAALLAALVAGYAILSGFLAADAEARRSGPLERRKLDARSVVLAIGLLLGAVLVAASSPQGIVALAGEGLAVIASSIFPAVVLGLYWRRFSGPGAVAAMLVGFVASAIYIFGLRLMPVTMYELSSHLSNASPSAISKFAQLKAVLAAAIDPAQRLKAETALREHAVIVANWWGLKPAAAVLFALPAALVAGAGVTLMRPPPSPSP